MPEVVQTSAMDCGPAALKCLLEGFGLHASYGRLREACQIDLDGTSIDTIEQVAGELGLGAEQIMVPADHLLLPEAETLPAVVVVAQPNGLTHFVVVWRRHGRLLQVMDPAIGRRWPTVEGFLSEVYLHRHRVPALGWREYAGSEDFLRPLAARLHHAGVPARTHLDLADRAVADPSWKGLAALDAGARMVSALARTGGVRRGGEAAKLLASLVERSSDGGTDVCPDEYWSVRPAAAGEGEREEWERDLELRGAVLVRVRPERAAPEVDAAAGHRPELAVRAEKLSPELAAALAEPEPRPGRELLRLLRPAGRWMPAALLGLLAVAAAGVVVEALLFRGFIDIGRDLTVSHQRLAGVAAIALFLLLLLAADLPAVEGALRLGRQLEARLRVAFLRKIPRLRDRYFASRLTSDMAERSHSVHRLRRLPDLGEWLARTVFELLLTTAGILWLDPGSAPLALATAAVVVGLPLVTLPLVQELDLRVRNHAGALNRFYLDAFLGLVPIRTHAAERAVEREHEGMLLDWARANLLRERVTLAADAVLQLAALGMIGWLVLEHLGRQGLSGALLLLVYWALNLFVLGQLVSLLLGQQYPTYRNVTLRLLEPLGAREEIPVREAQDARHGGAGATQERERSKTPSDASGGDASEDAESASAGGVELSYENVAVRAAGHTILRDVNFYAAPGEQVAIVGPSGAGKSTLVGLLLGWHRASAGKVRVDGRPLGDAELPALREATAWVDPAVRLWNRSLLDNLRYGLPPESSPDVARVVDQAELLSVLELLPDGLQSPLGEGGGLVSGGEGQRVRLARAMLRRRVRLVVLDEPFRGLDRRQRGVLLQRARELWRGATLLCITHDVSETLEFPRVLVLESGRIIEDGVPAEIRTFPGSRYQAMIDAEEAVRDGLWRSADWRRLRIEDGWLLEDRREAR